MGGPVTTHAGSTGIVLPPIVTSAVTGPSEVSSYQPSALMKLFSSSSL
ncbi:MAG TPA: hypothetical protein VF710_18690 [Longimicrobium sp.]